MKQRGIIFLLKASILSSTFCIVVTTFFLTTESPPPTTSSKATTIIKDLIGLLPSSVDGSGIRYSCKYNDSFAHVTEKPRDLVISNKNSIDQEYLTRVSKQLGIQLVANSTSYIPFQRPGPLQSYTGTLPYHFNGYDPVCSNNDTFISKDGWFRDNYISISCKTQPRERALAFVLANLLPHFKHASKVHESSPNDFGMSKQLQNIFGKEKYIASQFSTSQDCGETVNDLGHISLDLEDQHCILNATFDIIITQDVFEHIYEPNRAFKEIERTLKPGGFHVFTVPLTSKQFGTFQAAKRVNGNEVVLYDAPEIHGNPMGRGGSLLTHQWGYDIVQRIESQTGMKTKVVYLESKILGVSAAEYREVLISHKAGSSESLADMWTAIENIPVETITKDMITCTSIPV